MNVNPLQDRPPAMAIDKNKRALLIGGAALAGTFWGWPRLATWMAGPPDMEPIPGVPGFWRMASGPVSGGFDPLSFVSTEEAEAKAALREIVRQDVWTPLHQDARPGQVPIATFSDYLCPYCRVLTEKLSARAERDNLGLTWHEWPILGPYSVDAAKAALAAKRQGAYVTFHKTLMRGRFVAEEGVLRALARDLGIDGGLLIEDMHSASVAEELRISDALAGVLGFVGTPAMVIGRTVVVGEVDDRWFDALIDEAQDAARFAV